MENYSPRILSYPEMSFSKSVFVFTQILYHLSHQGSPFLRLEREKTEGNIIYKSIEYFSSGKLTSGSNLVNSIEKLSVVNVSPWKITSLTPVKVSQILNMIGHWMK